MAKTKQYQIQTIVGFEAPFRAVPEYADGRPGILIKVPARTTGPEKWVGELTDAQVELVKADRYLVLSELDAKGNVVSVPKQAKGGIVGSPTLPSPATAPEAAQATEETETTDTSTEDTEDAPEAA